MTNNILLFFSLITILSSEFKISGAYRVMYAENYAESDCSMSFENSKFTQKNKSGTLYKGTFSITDLSSQKVLLITSTKVLHSKTETDKVNFAEDGNIAFEITKSKSDTLIFRKFYTNQFEKTIAKGIFIKTQ
jgi:hypothetical protein